jgi:hypothetical protein
MSMSIRNLGFSPLALLLMPDTLRRRWIGTVGKVSAPPVPHHTILLLRPPSPPPTHPPFISPVPISKRRITSRASDYTIEPHPALTESEVSSTKIRVRDPSDEDDEDEGRVRESPAAPASLGNRYTSSLPIPYRTTRSVARELVPGCGGPRRKLNLDSKDSEVLNHIIEGQYK